MRTFLFFVVFFAALSAIATVFGAWLVQAEGASLLEGAFGGAAVAVVLLDAFGWVYRTWARMMWGAPFKVGDKVIVARGPRTGATGVVASEHEGFFVDVEFRGGKREEFGWGQLRRFSGFGR